MSAVDAKPWNRCDVCGRFIAMDDFNHGAVRQLVYPDSELTRETYETFCKGHAHWTNCGTSHERR